MNLIFLGQQGAGKGTYAQYVQEHYGFVQICTGDLFREEIKKGTKLGKQVEEKINNGIYIDDELTAKILEQRLKNKNTKKGFILDGYPRNLNQVKLLEKILKRLNKKLDRVVNFLVTDKISIQRISGRWLCPKCNHIYNINTLPPKVKGVCDLDKAKLYQREDDKPEAIKKRLEQHKSLMSKVIKFYKQKSLLKEIDANKDAKFVILDTEKLLKNQDIKKNDFL